MPGEMLGVPAGAVYEIGLTLRLGAAREACGSAMGLPTTGAGVMVPLFWTPFAATMTAVADSDAPLPTLTLGVLVESTITGAPVTVVTDELPRLRSLPEAESRQSAQAAAAIGFTTWALAVTVTLPIPSRVMNGVERDEDTVAFTVLTAAGVEATP